MHYISTLELFLSPFSVYSELITSLYKLGFSYLCIIITNHHYVHLDIIIVFFIYQLMHQLINNCYNELL